MADISIYLIGFWVLISLTFPLVAMVFDLGVSYLLDFSDSSFSVPWRISYTVFSYLVAFGALVTVSDVFRISFTSGYLLFLFVGCLLYIFDSVVVVVARTRSFRFDLIRNVISASEHQSTQMALGSIWSLLVAVPEEVVFRGVLVVLADYIGFPGYVFVSALVFGLAHLHKGRDEVFLKFWNGAVYCVGYLLTGSLLVPLFLHVGYNATFVVQSRR